MTTPNFLLGIPPFVCHSIVEKLSLQDLLRYVFYMKCCALLKILLNCNAFNFFLFLRFVHMSKHAREWLISAPQNAIWRKIIEQTWPDDVTPVECESFFRLLMEKGICVLRMCRIEHQYLL
jgi:hypothetical protein